MGIAVHPGDRPVHAVVCDGKSLAASSGSGNRVDDGKSVGTRVVINADDEVIWLCDDGHNLEPSFRVDSDDIGLEVGSCQANL